MNNPVTTDGAGPVAHCGRDSSLARFEQDAA